MLRQMNGEGWSYLPLYIFSAIMNFVVAFKSQVHCLVYSLSYRTKMSEHMQYFLNK